MKRMIALVTVLIIILSLAACGTKQIDTDNNNEVKKLMSEYKPLNELPEDYRSDIAEANGDVVSVHGKGYNIEKLDVFMESLKKNQPAAIRITQYTIEGDAIISDIIYNGKSILLTEDHSRDKFAGTGNNKIIKYKIKDIYITESDGGKAYEAKLENGQTMQITWIKSK